MKQKLIFHAGHSTGFYSEFNNMVLAILYCRRHNIDFELYSKDANFGQSKGWTDFFMPFCKETSNPIHHYINQRYEGPKGGNRKRLLDAYKMVHPHTFLTHDLWNDFRHISNTEMSPDEVRKAAGDIVSEIYRFNDVTLAEIKALMQKVTLDEPFIGFHVRGGDKIAENQLYNVESYVRKAEQMTDIRMGFVSSDDYRNVEEMRKRFPEWKFVSLTEESSLGYQQNAFNAADKISRRHDLINMMASMEYLCKAEMTFCTYSSNVGEFLGMRMGDRAIGIDYDSWMIW